MRCWQRGLKPVFVVVGVVALAAPLWPAQAQDVPVPVYTVDPFWPKVPFPNAWLIQGVPSMTTDDNDHIWVVSRSDDLRPDEAMATYSPPRRIFSSSMPRATC